MKRFVCYYIGQAGLLLVAACQPATHSAGPSQVAPTVAPPATPQPAPTIPPLPASSAAPRYVGTYAVADTADCPLTVTIVRKGMGYTFVCNGSSGPLEVTKQADGSTYFTFIGLKGEDPEENIDMLWQDSVLTMQNYGNAMNYYVRFSFCDAKYLEFQRRK